ncbi:hypothetical protein PTTW11_07592 [Pyrenophora teres f. teres]|uniref:Uncharacterized protein n=1 Tax=Pyrenophora teres f. teres TaxID=97479 RepID=A0A6S6W7K7_9PLEO|nr:hypothetical protein PTTW11_07592 [Pyrenophora teres f. teres]
MAPLTGSGISLTFPKDVLNTSSSNPHSKKTATHYKAASPAYNKQHLIVRPIDDLANTEEDDEALDPQNDVRIYKQVEIYGKERNDTVPAPTILLALMQPSSSGAKDLDAWYCQEHNEQMSKEPGWLRTCRYELVSQSSDDAEAKLTFLAIHEFGEGEQLGDMVKALQPVSEWTMRVMREAVGIDAAIYRALTS